MAQYPEDQFDRLPERVLRVGAHRAASKRGRGWVRFAWAALATGLLVVVGVVGLSIVNGRPVVPLPGDGIAAPTLVPAPEETVEPVTDPGTIDPALALSISVLNAAPEDGLEQVVGDRLEEVGWPVGARGVAAVRSLDRTVVYFNAPDYEAIAAGVAAAVSPDAVARASDVYQGAPVTVVVGSDLG